MKEWKRAMWKIGKSEVGNDRKKEETDIREIGKLQVVVVPDNRKNVKSENRHDDNDRKNVKTGSGDEEEDDLLSLYISPDKSQFSERISQKISRISAVNSHFVPTQTSAPDSLSPFFSLHYESTPLRSFSTIRGNNQTLSSFSDQNNSVLTEIVTNPEPIQRNNNSETINKKKEKSEKIGKTEKPENEGFEDKMRRATSALSSKLENKTETQIDGNVVRDMNSPNFLKKQEKKSSIWLCAPNEKIECNINGIGSRYFVAGKVNHFEIMSRPKLVISVQFIGCGISFEGYITEVEEGLYFVEYFPTRSGGCFQAEIRVSSVTISSITINPIQLTVPHSSSATLPYPVSTQTQQLDLKNLKNAILTTPITPKKVVESEVIASHQSKRHKETNYDSETTDTDVFCMFTEEDADAIHEPQIFDFDESHSDQLVQNWAHQVIDDNDCNVQGTQSRGEIVDDKDFKKNTQAMLHTLPFGNSFFFEDSRSLSDSFEM